MLTWFAQISGHPSPGLVRWDAPEPPLEMKGPFRTKNSTALESVLLCHCRSFSISVPFSCLFFPEKQALPSPLRSVLLRPYRLCSPYRNSLSVVFLAREGPLGCKWNDCTPIGNSCETNSEKIIPWPSNPFRVVKTVLLANGHFAGVTPAISVDFRGLRSKIPCFWGQNAISEFSPISVKTTCFRQGTKRPFSKTTVSTTLTLAFLKKARETPKKKRVFLFAEPLKSLEKKENAQKSKGNRKTKKARQSKKARIGGSGFSGWLRNRTGTGNRNRQNRFSRNRKRNRKRQNRFPPSFPVKLYWSNLTEPNRGLPVFCEADMRFSKKESANKKMFFHVILWITNEYM